MALRMRVASPCAVQKLSVFRSAGRMSFIASASSCCGHAGRSLNCSRTAACTQQQCQGVDGCVRNLRLDQLLESFGTATTRAPCF